MNLATLSPKERRAGVTAARLKPKHHAPAYPASELLNDDDNYDTALSPNPPPPALPNMNALGRPPDPGQGSRMEEAGPNSPDALPESTPPRTPSRLSSIFGSMAHHLIYHVGPGIIASVAYFDPGNWTVDLQAGSTYGYRLLFVVLLSGLGAVLLQVLACRLGVVTGLDLAQQCRILLYPRKATRYALLYPLYVLSECAIIFTDLAELLGSAIALNLIFPSLPLYAGVLITSADVLIILALWRPTNSASGGMGKLGRAFEMGIVLLVCAVLLCFVVLIVRVGPSWGPVFAGFIPNNTVFAPGALYISIGILGATVMPHALFLGSALATQNRKPASTAILTLPPLPPPPQSLPVVNPAKVPAPRLSLGKRIVKLLFWDPVVERVPREGNNPLSFVRSHLGHATADIVCSLVLLALVINAAILILGATAFYYNNTTNPGSVDADIFSAHTLLGQMLGPPAAFLFAFALLCSGQSASVTATMAGQIVSEGFLEWRTSPFLRRLLTRLIGLVPSTIVAVAAGRQGLDTLLVASQVALSICLPGVIFPLLWITDRKARMEVRGEGGVVVNYRNRWWASVLGWLLFAVVCAANAYAIVELALGAGS